MRIDPIHLHNQSKLLKDYRNNKTDMMRLFDYKPFQNSAYQDRLNDLRDRDFDRNQLVRVLHAVNQEWNAPDATFTNIDRLKNENSVVVIGGQQAGVLTGPLYTINKVVSIVQFARKQEKELHVPVIPVFWIAGEDHDYDEINHIFLPDAPKMKKVKLLQREMKKRSISGIKIDETYANQWLNHLFEQLDETRYTKSLFQSIKNALKQSVTYVDFFARIIFDLFEDEGLVLIDSGHPEVRKLEAGHFGHLIEAQPKFAQGVVAAASNLQRMGYTAALDATPEDAHLFLHNNEERILLVRNRNGDWIGKQNEVSLTTEELLEIAKNEPERISNNVVTRPIMQELLFPSLAFIGGPGEIAYWSLLKPAFHAVNIKMPPVLPRLSFTFVERHVEKILDKYAISASHAINSGIDKERDDWLKSRSNPPVGKLTEQLKKTVEAAHEPLRNIAQDLRSDLGDLAEKNLYYLFCDIEYLEGRIMKAIEEKYEKDLHEFAVLNMALHPNGGLQERIWNPASFINEHGKHFIKELAKESCSFEEDHYLVYI